MDIYLAFIYISGVKTVLRARGNSNTEVQGLHKVVMDNLTEIIREFESHNCLDKSAHSLILGKEYVQQ